MLRHNCVAVAEMGAFVCERKAAYFDENSRIWYPPFKRIRFISGNFPEDNILLKSVIRKFDVTVKEARSLIYDFATYTFTTVNATGICEYPGLGVFYKSDSGNIIFRSHKTPENEKFLSGYESINLNITSSDYSNSQENVTTNLLQPESETISNYDFRKNYYVTINKIFIKSVACIILFILLALSFVLPTSTTPQSDTMLTVNKPSIQNSHKKEKVMNVTTFDKILNNDLENKLANNSDSILKLNPKNCQYHLIVGTFSKESEARKYVSLNEDKEYKLIILPTKTLYRVACASSNRRDELQQELNSSKLKTNYKEAWIWNSWQNMHK